MKTKTTQLLVSIATADTNPSAFLVINNRHLINYECLAFENISRHHRADKKTVVFLSRYSENVPGNATLMNICVDLMKSRKLTMQVGEIGPGADFPSPRP
jgi:hypothetical protein